MNTRSKSNNFVAILIAVILFAIGFFLYFIHEQSQSNNPEDLGQSPPISAVIAKNHVSPLSCERFTA
jgi:hypothetical protein